MRAGLYVFTLLALVTASGCAFLSADYRYTQALEEWKDQPIDYALYRLGAPSAKNDRYYSWDYYREVHYEGRWVETTKRVDTYDIKGNRTGYYEMPVQEYREPWTHRRSCKTRIYIDRQKRITGFTFTGNYCGQWFEGDR